MARAARTNILSSITPVPASFEPETFEAWAIGVSQMTRFIRVGRGITEGGGNLDLLTFRVDPSRNRIYAFKFWIVGHRVSGTLGTAGDGWAAVFRGHAQVISTGISLVTRTAQFKELDYIDVSLNPDLDVISASTQTFGPRIKGAADVNIAWFARGRILGAAH